jgi:hypothetical protein
VGGRATHWGLGLAAALLGWGGYFAWIWPRRYGVDFVVIGEAERESFAARESAFQERWPLALERAGTRVYDVRAAGEGS